MAYRGFRPLFDRVLVQRVAAETKTKVSYYISISNYLSVKFQGGILLPGEAKQLPIAKVLSVGEGLRMEVSH